VETKSVRPSVCLCSTVSLKAVCRVYEIRYWNSLQWLVQQACVLWKSAQWRLYFARRRQGIYTCNFDISVEISEKFSIEYPNVKPFDYHELRKNCGRKVYTLLMKRYWNLSLNAFVCLPLWVETGTQNIRKTAMSDDELGANRWRKILLF
jgi:hypothetical protein